MCGGAVRLFQVGRHSWLASPRLRVAAPNWLVTVTGGCLVVPAVIFQHSRCALGLVMGKCWPPGMIFSTGLQCWSARDNVGLKLPNWFCSVILPGGGSVIPG